jgi:mono/diheme cytochrome c family protein
MMLASTVAAVGLLACSKPEAPPQVPPAPSRAASAAPAAPAAPATPEAAPAAPATPEAAPAAPASLEAAPAAAAAPALDPVAEADALYTSRCVLCHGQRGAGDGPTAGALNPKPRAFGDAEWQKSVTDEAIEKIILSGGPAVGKSPLMPPNPDLAAKPAVLAALRAKIRGFAK